MVTSLTDWNDGELNYLAALVRTGSDSPRVGRKNVDAYLEVQHAGARRDRRPDVSECITLLQMIRAQTDETVQTQLWREFWARVHHEVQS